MGVSPQCDAEEFLKLVVCSPYILVKGLYVVPSCFIEVSMYDFSALFLLAYPIQVLRRVPHFGLTRGV